MQRRDRRSGFGRRFPPTPVQLGNEYDVELKEVSSRGQAIA